MSVMKEKEAIFQASIFRIPALCNINKETLVAFAEQLWEKSPHTKKTLVMKTGSVNKDGTTNAVTVTWSETKTVKEAHLKGYRPMNPCPLYDKKNNKLFLFFICVEGTVTEQLQISTGCNKTRLCYVTSTDTGRTWSQVTDLTDRLAEIKQWATFAVGPGHGIQTVKGRLIVPVYAYSSCCKSCSCKTCNDTVPRARCLYSDDNGATWQFGKMFEKTSIECEMAEICDDKGTWTIYCNTRTYEGHRVEAVSGSDGEAFSVLKKGTLVETGSGCQGSVVSFPAQNEGAKKEADQSQNPKWLLFAHPSNKDKRKDLGVYVNKSPTEPDKWSKPWIINKGTSGYSDLAYIGEGMFACLMEYGEKDECEQIAFMVFSYSDIKPGAEMS